MNRMVVEEVSGAEALDELRHDWKSLHRANSGIPFLSWEWLSAWRRWLGGAVEPRILRVRDGARLVALLPLASREVAVAPGMRPVRRLSFLGDGPGGADYLDLLAGDPDREEALRAISDYLAADRSFDLLELDGVAAGSPLLPALRRNFEGMAGFTTVITPRYVCPRIELKRGWTKILSESGRGENYRRQSRKLAALRDYGLRVRTEPGEIEDAFERFLLLHEDRWSPEGGSDATGHERLRAFHREAVALLARAGMLRFEELWVEGGCRASIYCLEDGRNSYCYSSGYDRSWSRFSPGMILLGLSIRSAAERGLEYYDLLRGSEPYKFQWANELRETVLLRISRRRLSARALRARESAGDWLRDGAKRMLPESGLRRLRRWFREYRRAAELERGA